MQRIIVFVVYTVGLAVAQDTCNLTMPTGRDGLPPTCNDSWFSILLLLVLKFKLPPMHQRPHFLFFERLRLNFVFRTKICQFLRTFLKFIFYFKASLFLGLFCLVHQLDSYLLVDKH